MKISDATHSSRNQRSTSGPEAEPHPGPQEAFLGTKDASRERQPRRWWGLLSVAVVSTSVTALLGFGLTREPTVVRSPLIGRRAPVFDLPLLAGEGRIRLADLSGSIVVVNFWASWCAACRQEHPSLLGAWNRYRDQGVVFVGIDYQDSTSAANAYLRELGGDWPVVIDPSGRTALAYGVYGVPETFFIDHTGTIRYKQIGASSYELLITQIERLLSQRGAGSG